MFMPVFFRLPHGVAAARGNDFVHIGHKPVSRKETFVDNLLLRPFINGGWCYQQQWILFLFYFAYLFGVVDQIIDFIFRPAVYNQPMVFQVMYVRQWFVLWWIGEFKG